MILILSWLGLRRDMQNKKIIWGAILIIVIAIALLYVFSGKKENRYNIINKVASIERKKVRVEKIDIGDKNSPGRIRSVCVSRDKIYILDKYYYKVMVYDKKFNFLYSMGRVGQGPGEIYNPGGISINNDKIYIFNTPSRFEVYSTDGKFLKTIKLKFGKNNNTKIDCSSFAIHEKKIYLYYLIGFEEVKVFDINGNYLKTLIKREGDGYRIAPGNSYLADLRKIYINSFENHMALSSLLDGSSEIYDLRNGKMILKYILKEKDTNEFLKRIREKMKTDKKESSVINVKIFAFYTVSYDLFNRRVWLLKRKKYKSYYTLYIINISGRKIRKIYFSLDKDIEILKFFFTDKNEIYIIDDNYDIYKFRFTEGI